MAKTKAHCANCATFHEPEKHKNKINKQFENKEKIKIEDSEEKSHKTEEYEPEDYERQ